MERLTISKITEETGAYELAHNCTFIRDLIEFTHIQNRLVFQHIIENEKKSESR